MVTSAQLPSLIMPRLARRIRVAGHDVILRTASGSVSTCRSFTYFAITRTALP